MDYCNQLLTVLNYSLKKQYYTMLVPKKNRLAVYSYLFKEGVMVAPKNFAIKNALVEVPNLHVVKLMQSLHSRGYVAQQFNWQWFYYKLTNEGIEYLREYLHVSADTVPATLKKASKPQPPPSFGRFGGDRGGRGGSRGGGRDGYRSGPRDGDAGKESGAPGGFRPEFGDRRGRGGFGRGGARGGRGGRGGSRGGGSM